MNRAAPQPLSLAPWWLRASLCIGLGLGLGACVPLAPVAPLPSLAPPASQAGTDPMAEVHLQCGMGSAPIAAYRQCLVETYQRTGGVHVYRQQLLAAIDEADQAVQLQRITLAQAYKQIAFAREQAVAATQAANRDIARRNQQIAADPTAR